MVKELVWSWAAALDVRAACAAQIAVARSRGVEFSPRTTGLATVQFGSVSFGQPGPGESDIYALTGSLMHRLSDKLTAGMQVAWTSSTSSSRALSPAAATGDVAARLGSSAVATRGSSGA